MYLCAIIGLLGFSVQFDLETRVVALDNTDNTLNPTTRSGTVSSSDVAYASVDIAKCTL
jgi:hypothetical protein